jgi:pilus assembly protein CpaE
MVCALDVFDNLKYPRDIIQIILNWTFQRHGLGKKDIENAIKRPIDLVIPFASDSFVSAINFGTPLVLSDPTGPLGAIFEDLAFTLSKDEQKKQRPPKPTASWQRVAVRWKQSQHKKP